MVWIELNYLWFKNRLFFVCYVEIFILCVCLLDVYEFVNKNYSYENINKVLGRILVVSWDC